MKTPHLLASFAVAATAVAADFKDPSEVVRNWQENTYVGHSPLTWDLSLRRQTMVPPLYSSWPVYMSDCWPAPKPPAPPRNPLQLDAPRYRAPEVLSNNLPMPRGAKPWLYGGQTYWVMPLIPSREK